MITAEFFKNAESGKLLGFSVSGHADYDDIGLDIVCASVTSAVIMTMNNATDIFKIDANAKDLGNELLLKLGNDSDGIGDKLVLGLLTQLYIIRDEFPESLKVIVTDR